MTNKLKIFTLTLALLLAGDGFLQAATAGDWTNPIVPQRADPHVFLHTDGYYYLIATVPEYDRIELRRAKTLGGLTDAPAKVIWRKHDHGEMGAHIWAPEIHHIGGKWYVYFTAAPAENIWEIRPYVLKCDDRNPLTGKWEEKGRVKLAWESFSLDATVFSHEGKYFYVWTQRGKAPFDGTNIYIAQMDTPTSIIGDPVMLTCPEYWWETRRYRVNEAPAVLVSHGKVFLTYSASSTDANYCLGMLTADADDDLLDPGSWTKSPEPVLKSSVALVIADNVRRTTDAFQLATTVTYQSPLQHFALTPDNLSDQPDYVIDFLKKVPAVWVETRYVDGYPGEFIVLARRSGKQWYVAATHAGKEERDITITLPAA